jgi:hypothetical protein
VYKFLGAVFGLAGVDHFWSDDKILALLIVILALVWIAVPPGRATRTR